MRALGCGLMVAYVAMVIVAAWAMLPAALEAVL